MKRFRSRISILGFIALLLCLCGDAVHASSDYAVRADDKLKIKIFQYPEVSGEYTVSANGTILVAPVGEVAVAGHTTKEISKLISDRFIKSRLSDKPGITVELLQTRPIYVLGDVQKPGEYPYRPGMTVLQAVSLAGGWLRFTDPGLMRVERDAITIKGDMRSLVRRYYHLVAQQARLNSELAMKTDVDFPDELERKAKNDKALTQLINEERSFFTIHVESLRKQIDSLEKARNLYEREVDAITRQVQASQRQHNSVQKELKEIKALFARGLTPISRQTNLERMQAQIEMTEQGFQTLILRARQGIAQVDQKIFDLSNQKNARLTAELQRTRMDLAEIGIKFETDQSLLVEAQLTAPRMASGSDDLVETRSFTVDRVQNGKSVTLDADEHVELLPGDVLKIQRSILPSAAGMAQFLPHKLIMPTGTRIGE